jgi:hypothetical protein
MESKDPDLTRRKVLLGGAETFDPSLPDSEQPVKYYSRFGQSESNTKKRRGGFFSRRGSVLLFIDIVIVAIIALTIYPMYGRKDQGRWNGYKFSLDAHTIDEGLFVELTTRAPRQDDRVRPGKPFDLYFRIEDTATEPVSLLLPAKAGESGYYRRIIPVSLDSSPDSDSVVHAFIDIDGERVQMRLGL